jgi:DNA-binding NarL/FixJ family response regulator
VEKDANKQMNARIMTELPAGAAPESSDQQAPLCIWLMDEDACNNEILAPSLTSEPHVDCSRCFSSAPSLLAALEQEYPPDAILLELQMPVMNSIKVIRHIKNLAPFTLVLMLTASDDSRSKQQALLAGASDILLKCSSPGQIIAAIRKALRSY